MTRQTITVSKAVTLMEIFHELIGHGWQPYRAGLWIKSYGDKEDRWGVMLVKGHTITRLRDAKA